MCAHEAYALIQVTGVSYKDGEDHMECSVELSTKYVTWLITVCSNIK